MLRKGFSSLTSVLSALAIAASVNLAAPASATEQVLLVQSAPKSTVKTARKQHGSRFLCAHKHNHSRPSLSDLDVWYSKSPNVMPVALWGKSFGEIAPNAILTGTTSAGKAQKYIFTLNSARSTAKGVRYTAELLSGNLKSSELVRLTNTDMLIDGYSSDAGEFSEHRGSCKCPRFNHYGWTEF